MADMFAQSYKIKFGASDMSNCVLVILLLDKKRFLRWSFARIKIDITLKIIQIVVLRHMYLYEINTTTRTKEKKSVIYSKILKSCTICSNGG